MCFGGSKGPRYEKPLPKPAPIQDVVPVDPLPEETSAAPPSTTPTAEARRTADTTGLAIPI